MAWRLVVLYFLFTIEIRVHANNVELPENCAAGAKGCTIWFQGTKSGFYWQDQNVAVTKGSILNWKSDKAVHLIKGSIGLDLQETLKISTLMGEITGYGWVVVERLEEKTRVSCFTGQLSLKPIGFSDPLILSAGFFMDLLPVKENGQAFAEIPQLLPLQPSLVFWWRHFRNGKKEFLAQARDFLSQAQDRAERAGQWQEELANRYIASVWEQRRREAESKRKAEAEGKRMRALFRKMNHLDEEL